MSKILRKRTARLNARSVAQQKTRDEISKKGKLVPVEAYRMPGSMSGRK